MIVFDFDCAVVSITEQKIVSVSTISENSFISHLIIAELMSEINKEFVLNNLVAFVEQHGNEIDQEKVIWFQLEDIKT